MGIESGLKGEIHITNHYCTLFSHRGNSDDSGDKIINYKHSFDYSESTGKACVLHMPNSVIGLIPSSPQSESESHYSLSTRQHQRGFPYTSALELPSDYDPELSKTLTESYSFKWYSSLSKLSETRLVVLYSSCLPLGILPVPWQLGHVTLSRPVNSTQGNWDTSSLFPSSSSVVVRESSQHACMDRREKAFPMVTPGGGGGQRLLVGV